jgi:hypothetical protein
MKQEGLQVEMISAARVSSRGSFANIFVDRQDRFGKIPSLYQ